MTDRLVISRHKEIIMKNVKYAVIGFAALGMLSCFLAFVPGASWFDLRVEFGSRAWTLIVGMIIALLGGAAGVAMGWRRWHGVVATLGFLTVWVALEFKTFDLFDFAIGAKLMALAAIGGLAAAIIGAVKPAPAD